MASYLDKDGLKAVWSRVVTQTYDQANDIDSICQITITKST